MMLVLLLGAAAAAVHVPRQRTVFDSNPPKSGYTFLGDAWSLALFVPLGASRGWLYDAFRHKHR